MSRYPTIKIGEKYNNLTIISRAENYITPKGQKHSRWLCECDCGNRTIVNASELKSGKTKACGCLSIKYNHSKGEDLTGQKFNMLTVINKAPYYITPNTNKKYIQWNCLCDCGNSVVVKACDLKNGSIKSCGCFQAKWPRSGKINDLTGRIFCNLEVLYLDKVQNGYSYWTCKCTCGNVISVKGTSLSSGMTKSCGCIKSQGEQKIIKLLNEYNIPYVTQKSFNNCPIKARFDFFINNEYLIEYDGKQHYKVSKGWNDESNFLRNQERDRIKNQFCVENNIPLIRIPYTHFDKLCIEDLLLESSSFVFYSGISKH